MIESIYNNNLIKNQETVFVLFIIAMIISLIITIILVRKTLKNE